MAILKTLKCQVCVDSVALKEYDDDDEQAPAADSVTKYVEAVAGTTFSLKLTVLPGWRMKCDYLDWYIDLDGMDAVGGIVSHDKYSKSTGFMDERFGVRSGAGCQWNLNRFKFADIVIGDLPGELRGEALKTKYEKLGLITVKVWRKKLLSVTPASEAVLPAPNNKVTGPIPEKALKGQALSLSTGFGADETTAAPAIWHVALQQLLILPRSPTPVPLEERDPKDLTPTEAQELIRRQKARLASMTAVKQERVASAKRERRSTGPTRPTKVAKTSSGQGYLDLDDSDDEVIKIEERPARRKLADAEIEVIDLLD